MSRLAVIGAGSVEFTRNIIADLCSYRELHGSLTVALHDIDDERLEYSARAARSIVERTGAGYTVEAHADRRAALGGASYVINEIQVGGYQATLRDFEIPKKYGLRQTIGDTIGIGDIFRRFGYFPTESSEHSSEYVPWFLHHEDQVEHFRAEIDEYIRRSDENLLEWEQTKQRLDAGHELEVEPASELASEIVHSLETGTPREVYVNVRNGGLIEGLPEDACVEVPALVDKNGVQPTRIGAVPPQCLALNRTFLNVVELTVRAALEQRRELVYQAALLDPNTAATLAIEQILDMVDELIDAHGELIPEAIRAAPPAAR